MALGVPEYLGQCNKKCLSRAEIQGQPAPAMRCRPARINQPLTIRRSKDHRIPADSRLLAASAIAGSEDSLPTGRPGTGAAP